MLGELEDRLRVEAAFLFGSWSRSGGGPWSDVDLLVVSDDAESIDVLERFRVASLYRRKHVDLFIYTYRELEEMTLRGNPIALSALIEGIPLKLSSRVEMLARKARESYTRIGRVWIRLNP